MTTRAQLKKLRIQAVKEPHGYLYDFFIHTFAMELWERANYKITAGRRYRVYYPTMHAKHHHGINLSVEQTFVAGTLLPEVAKDKDVFIDREKERVKTPVWEKAHEYWKTVIDFDKLEQLHTAYNASYDVHHNPFIAPISWDY